MSDLCAYGDKEVRTTDEGQGSSSGYRLQVWGSYPPRVLSVHSRWSSGVWL